MNWADLPGLFPMVPGAERWLPLLQEHLRLLVEAEHHTRVTAVAPEDAVRRQYAESLETWRIAIEALGDSPASTVDVGSGGGFPGLVMACVAPDCRFALVEPLQKRARLLKETAAALGLENVDVYSQRAEDAGRGTLRDSASLVTARAVAALPELLELTAPLTALSGLIALPKGSSASEELGAAARAMSDLRCSYAGAKPMRREVSGTLAVLLFRKAGATPDRYPRRPGVPAKRPL